MAKLYDVVAATGRYTNAAGEEKTRCEKTARLNLARAKYRAAIEAMVEAQAAAAKPGSSAGT